jgi:inosine/xanthosine triphosphate pyrophosphatase family protein
MSEDDIPLPLITTSSRKFDHLRFLAYHNNLKENYGVELVRVPLEYKELQSDDMELLLHDAIKGKAFDEIRDTFFLIEQTSVFFDAMDGEGPGQYFKKWWNTKSEEDLKLKFSQNQGATIESGLALNIPGHDPLVFVNRTRGKINMDGEIREENQKYSWLSSDDFNLYFIPQGANKVYNQMEMKEFLNYDFRKSNFDQVSERMGEYASIINNNLTTKQIRGELESNVKQVIYKDASSFTEPAEDPNQSNFGDL